MSTGEVLGGAPENDIERALDFCEGIRHAVELRDLSRKLELKAQRAGQAVSMESMIGELPYQLVVRVPEGVEAHILMDDTIVDPSPVVFRATEVWSINDHGVEFINRDAQEILAIRGYKFDIKPWFADEALQADSENVSWIEVNTEISPERENMLNDLTKAAREAKAGPGSDDIPE